MQADTKYTVSNLHKNWIQLHTKYRKYLKREMLERKLP